MPGGERDCVSCVDQSASDLCVYIHTTDARCVSCVDRSAILLLVVTIAELRDVSSQTQLLPVLPITSLTHIYMSGVLGDSGFRKSIQQSTLVW
ncbi:hypothetical protein DPEC_G00246110 [Dallia pectoralis]|uniref:Uncharacterized protein n=1 Tax=Dallia pectoralis TaxID=75939 RepID=A0ACC2FWG0_DALPE|nr:hypothetical protein DPEC_G00246110 [Dallia pectoralis]